MKYFSSLVLLTASLVFSSTALALDCAKARSELDKFICSDDEMKQADEKMRAAFFRLLTKTKDKDFREALLKSQRRWLANRTPDNKIWAGGASDDNPAKFGPETKQFIIDASANRESFLASNDPISTVKSQRDLRAGDGNGEYGGYNTSCWFVEPPWGGMNEYLCVGTIRRQKAKRVCTESMVWASGHKSSVRVVSEIADGKLKHTATCQEGYSGTSCPGAEADEGAHWMLNPKDVDPLIATTKGFWKFDPDAETIAGGEWLNECIQARIYPPPGEAKAE
jgi:uncharacterized protein YecT (DUF1311 family)